MDTEESSENVAPFRQFQELALYFFGAGLVGHYVELFWVLIRFGASDQQYIHGALMLLPLPISEPFGFGAMALVLLLIPWVEKHRPNLGLVYIVSALLMAGIEYICAAALALAYGHNWFWDYSHMPFNLQGYICLETSLAFGLAALFFMYVAYPFFQPRIRKLNTIKMQMLFWGLLLLYSANLLRIILVGRS
jgi:uncharacterized membrane protein